MSDLNDLAVSKGHAFFVRMVTKVALKAAIWCVMAAIVTYFWPAASWIWFVVLAFVLIGLGVAVIGRLVMDRTERRK